MNPARALALLVTLGACGSRTSVDSLVIGGAADAGGASGDASATLALTIGLGTYPGCVATTVNVAPHEDVTAGADGKMTLSLAGPGELSVALAFPTSLTGTVAVAPTSARTAALATGSFTAQTLDFNNASATVPVTAGVLAVVEGTLFVSVYGKGSDTALHGYVRCPLVPSLPQTKVVVSAPPSGPFPTGTYAGCTTDLAAPRVSSLSGGDSSRTITLGGGVLTASEAPDAGYPIVCGDLGFLDLATSTATAMSTLASGASCTIQQPCGPGPTLGPSLGPTLATLTNMEGVMAVSGGVLFLDVLGDAPKAACGQHSLSLLCPVGP